MIGDLTREVLAGPMLCSYGYYDPLYCNDSGLFFDVSYMSFRDCCAQLAMCTDMIFGIVMTRQRNDAVKFSPQFFPLQYDIIYRKLDQQEWNFTFYFQPCTIEIWLCIFAACVTVILVKVLAENSLLRTIISRRNPVARHFLNVINELLLCWPIVLQGNFNSFALKSMKFIFAIYTVFSMLLLISYNSKLTSLLATTTMKIPFTSLDDMLQNTDFTPVILYGGRQEETFMNTAYANKKVLRVPSHKKGIESVYSGKFAFLEALMLVENLIRRNCSFAVAPNYLSKEAIALAYSKQFAYTDFFNSKSLLLKQYGILSCAFKRFIPSWEGCANNPFNPISMGQTIGLFILMMAGIFISLICGIIELIVNKFLN
uniref:Ionotropic glutamate receptor C-terminal domain-containing protein n=1 Tax=Strigamia maritima TaxID=126957 RepID=T1JLK6_STRMM